MVRYRSVVAIVLVLAALPCAAQSTTTATSKAASQATTRPAGVAVEALTRAEQILRVRKAAEYDQQQIDEIDRKLKDPNSEFKAAEAEFGKLDSDLADLKKRKQQAAQEDRPDDAQAIEAQIQELTKKWAAARERFGLAVAEREALQAKAAALQKKLEQDKATLEAMLAPPSLPVASGANAPGKAPAATSASQPVATAPAAAASPALASGPVAAPAPTSQPAGVVPSGKPLKPKEVELAKAVEEATAKKAEVQQAAQKLQAAEQAKATMEQNIAMERKLLEIAQARQQQAKEEQNQIRKDLDQANDPQRRQELWSKLLDARQRESQAVADIKASEESLRELQDEQGRVEADRKAKAAEVSAKEEEVAKAEKKVQELQNPFTPSNLMQWVIDHGPRLLMIVVGMTLLHLAVRGASRRIAELVAQNTSRGSLEDRQNRANTLVGVFRQTASLIILGGGTVMFLEEAGVPVVPLLGGAAVVGLAVAFGAQNLIRDCFAGFMVLVEDQYSVGDVVRIGEISGLVERITMRMTMLRDMEGTAHFIPHGTITSVSNLTHTWSRALFDIPVAYDEDVDRAIAVLEELAREICSEPAYADRILGEPEMLGVDAFGESSVSIKFIIKTRPMKQWTIKRELLRRIKNRFDALGIEIPFPHLTVNYRNGEAPDKLLGDFTPESANRDVGQQSWNQAKR